MYLKNQKGWEGNPAKLTRATSFAGSDWSQAMIAHLWSDSRGNLLIDPASGIGENGNVITTKYNDFENLIWLGYKSGITPIFNEGYDDIWYCIEAHIRLNDPGSENGVQEFWIDNNHEAGKNNLNFVGTYTEYAINAVFFENYWNDGSLKLQERYFDNIVVSRSRIGCGCSPLSISPPNLPDATTNTAYSYFLQATGGFPEYQWQLFGGDLPPGITLDEATGEVSGTTSQTGTFTFGIGVRDSDAIVRYDTSGASLVVTNPSSVANNSVSKALNVRFNTNSFDKSIDISFGLQHPASVQLVIFNSIGGNMGTIIQEYSDAGNHQIIYSGSHLSTGIYFYTFRAGEYFGSGKFIISY